ncbi:MAG TPA: hypothetical protein VFA75_19795, partial [Nevskia sp.]|nr:hypothetical protein [Nevskia sp.]
MRQEDSRPLPRLQLADLRWLESHHLRVVRIGGNYAIPCGADIAKLARAAEGAFPWLFAGVSSDLAKLADLCTDFEYDRLAIRTQTSAAAMGGFLRSSPLHSALVGGGKQADLALWMRAALLRWMLGKCYPLRHLDEQQQRNRWCRFLWSDRADQVRPAILNWVAGLGQQLALAAAGCPTDPVLRCESTELLKLQDSINTVFRQLLSHAKALHTLEIKKPWRSSSLSDDSQLIEDGIPENDLVEEERNLEVEGDDDDEEDEPASDKAPPRPNLARPVKPAELERLAVDSHILKMLAPLLPDSEESLTPVEFRACMSWLERCLDPATRSDIRGQLDIVSIALSGITARAFLVTRRAVLEWIYRGCPAEPASEFAFSIARDCWKTTIPDHERFWSPKTDAQRNAMAWTAQSCGLPMPEWIASALGSLGSRAAEVLALELQDQPDERTLLKLRGITPRFTLTRFRKTLPIAVYTCSGALFDAQIVVGESLGRSTAPLHYYSFEANRIVGVYAKALRWMLGDEFQRHSKEPRSAGRIGAPAAALQLQAVKTAVEALKDRTLAAIRRTNPIQAFNALVIYCACFFLAATGHRQTFRLAQITARSFDYDIYLAVFGDKIADLWQVARVVALTRGVIEQIREVRRAALTLANRLDRESPGAAKALMDLANGSSSLFAVVDVSSDALRPLNRQDLQQHWTECPFPLPLLRARMATRLLEHGVAPGNIYRQLGHAMDVDHGAEDDPVPIPAWSKAIADALDEVLSQDGWMPIRIAPGEAASNTRLTSRTAAKILRAEEAFWRRERRRLSLSGMKSADRQAFRTEILQRCEGLMAALYERYDPKSPQKGLILAQAEVSALKIGVAEVADTPEKERIAREVLIEFLRAQVRSHRWKVWGRLTPLFKWKPAAPRISPACTDAARWCSLVSSKLHATTPASLEEWLVWGSVLLVVEGGLTNPERLKQVLRGLRRVFPYPNRTDAVLVELEFDPGRAARANDFERAEEPNHKTIVFGVTLVALSALFAARVTAKLARNPEVLDTVLETLPDRIAAFLTSELGERSQPLETLCKLAAMGRRLTGSGLLAAYEDGTIPARDLSPERMWQLQTG